MSSLGPSRMADNAIRLETAGDEDDQLHKSAREITKKVNWMVGVSPQDVRFPVNIIDIAMTENYFAAMTSDRTKIFINRRIPEDKANCKKKTIEFDFENKPKTIVPFECNDTLCVCYPTRLEFYDMVSLEKSFVYSGTLGESIAAISSWNNRSPMGVLWYTELNSQSKKKPGLSTRHTKFTYLIKENIKAPKEIVLDKALKCSKKESYDDFVWTSNETMLLLSGLSETHSDEKVKNVTFHSVNIAMMKTIAKYFRKTIESKKALQFSEDKSQFCIYNKKSFLIVSSIFLNDLQEVKYSGELPGYFDYSINSNSNIFILDKETLSLQIFTYMEGMKKLHIVSKVPLKNQVRLASQSPSSFTIHSIGNIGALFIYKYDGKAESEQLKAYTSYSTVALVDLSGNVIVKAEWPRGFVYSVGEEMLIFIQYLSVKPFSAAHVSLFDFNVPITKRSVWTKQNTESA